MFDEIKEAICQAANHVVVFGSTARMSFPVAKHTEISEITFPAEAVPSVARHFWEVDARGNVVTYLRCHCGRRAIHDLEPCPCGCGVAGRLQLSKLITAYEQQNGLFGVVPKDNHSRYREERWEWDFDETTLWTVFDTIKNQPGQDRAVYHKTLRRIRQPLSMIQFIYILDELLSMNAIQQKPLQKFSQQTVGFILDQNPHNWPEFPVEWSYIA